MFEIRVKSTHDKVTFTELGRDWVETSLELK